MSQTENEKFIRIGRQAMNIQGNEVVSASVDSDGRRISGTEHSYMFIYNLENITAQEVEQKVHDGTYGFDSRILVSSMEQFKHIFPHAGEAKRQDASPYWKQAGNRTERACSVCGFIVATHDALEFDETTGNYTKIRYRFCPHCGAFMRSENAGEERNG